MDRTSLGEVEGDAIAVQFTPAKSFLMRSHVHPHPTASADPGLFIGLVIAAGRVDSLDHLVCAGNQCWWNGNADFLRRFKIDQELEFRGLLDWNVRRLFAPQNLVDESSRTTKKD